MSFTVVIHTVTECGTVLPSNIVLQRHCGTTVTFEWNVIKATPPPVTTSVSLMNVDNRGQECVECLIFWQFIQQLLYIGFWNLISDKSVYHTW